MVKKIIWLILLFNVILCTSFAADFYVNYNFNYEYGTNFDDVQIKVFKCQDSTCKEKKVQEIIPQLYSQSAQSSCFKNLNFNQMNSCMNNYKISGDKASSEGVIVKLTDVTPGEKNYYYLVFSVRGDTFLIPYHKTWVLTQLNEYDYTTNTLNVDFTKSVRPKANIQSFFVENLENRNLPIQVNIQTGMSSTVCSGFRDISGNLKRPQFDLGFSDYAAQTDISLQIIDKQTGNILTSDTKTIDIEASSCDGFHTFEWTPPSNFENREVEFRVTTDIVDEQAHLPRRDQDSKIVTIYPENLTNACWIVGNNLVVANKDTTNPQVGDFKITVGEDAFLSFEALGYKSKNQDGSNLQFIDYRARISVEGIQIIDEVITSNLGLYKRNIKEELKQFSAGEVKVTVLLDPIGQKCTKSERTTLTTKVTLKEETPKPSTPPVLHTPILLNGGTNQEVQGQISAFDQKDGNLTNQITCTTNSNRISINLQNGQLTVNREDRFSINTQIHCQVTNSNGLSSTNSTQILFDLQNQAPLVNITPNVHSGFEILHVNFQVSAVDPDGDQITCEIFVNGVSRLTNDCEAFTKSFNKGIYTIEIVVTDEFGLSRSDSTTIEVFEKLPQKVTLNVNPQKVFVKDPIKINYTVIDSTNFVNCILETNGKLLQAIGGGSCIGNFTFKTSYMQAGIYNVTLTTVDNNGLVVTKTQEVEVIEVLNPKGTLKVTPEKSFAPSNIEVQVEIIHPQNLSLTCEIFKNGQVIGTNCTQIITLQDVAGGTHTFTAIGEDERGNVIELIDSILVLREEDKLQNQNIIVDTQLGDNSNVDVRVTYANETLAQRVTRFRPYIVCEDGIVNNLQNEQSINAALKSRNMVNDVEFGFELFINDFQLQVEYDKECTLQVEFWDNYGFIDQRSAPIIFKRLTQEAGIPSVRGQGIDFRNHLTTLLQDSTFTTGNNQFSVVLINNENEAKTVDYTITGQQINIRSSGSYNLQPNEERVVPMTINVPLGTEDGTYLVRITMTHNDVRESKLTHIRVGEESMLPTYTTSQNEEGFGQSRAISLPKNCSTC